MNNKSKRSFSKQCFATLAVMCLVFAGCQSVQRDLMLPSAGETAQWSLVEIEELVIRLDGAGASRDELNRVRRQITALEGTVADTHFDAVLAAWSGRLYLMEGRASNAQRELRRSQNLSPRNLPALILSVRVERDLSRRLEMIDSGLQASGAAGELLLERGRLLFELNRFSQAVAAFDAAFVALNEKPFYEEAYRVFRDKAWELRDMETAAGNRTAAIVLQGEITWRDLIEITRSETELLRFITAGRDWPAETLFAQLLDRAFIPRSQEATLTEWPAARPASNEPVLRSGAAWFLWHLNAENRANRGLLTRYSARFSAMPNARSPIPDLPLSSPFLDSVLGCVESEFMSLPDGRHFMPGERVRGSDFLSMLRRLER